MRKQIGDIYTYLSHLESKLNCDLQLNEHNQNIKFALKGASSETMISIRKRALTFSYDLKDTISVTIYEQEKINKTLDKLIFQADGKVIRDKNKKEFETHEIMDYLAWFKK